jgi:hypothetical protein
MTDEKRKILIKVLSDFIINTKNKTEEEITDCLISNGIREDKKNNIKELLEKIKKLRKSGKTDDEIPSLICIELDGKDDYQLDLLIELLKELIKRLKMYHQDQAVDENNNFEQQVRMVSGKKKKLI